MDQYSAWQYTYPKGYINIRDTDIVPNKDPYGNIVYATPTSAIEHRQILHGDFDIQVDFNEVYGDSTNGNILAMINVQTSPTEQLPIPEGFQVSCARQLSGHNTYYTTYYPTNATSSITTTDTSGTLRIVRTGTTIACYHGGSSTPDNSDTYSAYNQDCYLSLQLYCYGAHGSVRWNNFKSNSSLPVTYTQSTPVPSYTSAVFDSGQAGTVTWGKLNFTGTVPTGTNLQFQVATSSSASGPFTFVGPDGTAATYFTTSGTALHTGTTGRFCVYKSYLTPNAAGTATPSFSAVSISYSLAGSSTSAQYTYSIDDGGNILHANVTTDAGTSTSIRTVNNLNQILHNAVTPAGGSTTTYVQTYNADGTLATKTDGTNNWVYNWSPEGDQRLLSVVYNGTTQASYTYDYMGRMLTRTVSGVTTTFEWDNWTCIRETTTGAQTRYYAPWGQLLTFERGGIIYQVISDALGSVRLVTDNTGAVVARLDYDPYGNLLSTSTDSVPGGMPYRFVGALGCRWDSATGLIYMRQRWYDPAGLQRFMSRDPLRSPNRYAYCSNDPTNYVDPSGLWPNYSCAEIKDAANRHGLDPKALYALIMGYHGFPDDSGREYPKLYNAFLLGSPVRVGVVRTDFLAYALRDWDPHIKNYYTANARSGWIKYIGWADFSPRGHLENVALLTLLQDPQNNLNAAAIVLSDIKNSLFGTRTDLNASEWLDVFAAYDQGNISPGARAFVGQWVNLDKWDCDCAKQK